LGFLVVLRAEALDDCFVDVEAGWIELMELVVEMMLFRLVASICGVEVSGDVIASSVSGVIPETTEEIEALPEYP
jgi:hypothetical protein